MIEKGREKATKKENKYDKTTQMQAHVTCVVRIVAVVDDIV